jgi:hypothetical protein
VTTFFPSEGIPQLLCECIPTGVTQCSYSEYPTCGGACSGDGVCQALSDNRGSPMCGCVDPSAACESCRFGRCPTGLVCLNDPGGAIIPECNSACLPP